jgi:hypothetical protein
VTGPWESLKSDLVRLLVQQAQINRRFMREWGNLTPERRVKFLDCMEQLHNRQAEIHVKFDRAESLAESPARKLILDEIQAAMEKLVEDWNKLDALMDRYLLAS